MSLVKICIANRESHWLLRDHDADGNYEIANARYGERADADSRRTTPRISRRRRKRDHVTIIRRYQMNFSCPAVS